MFQEIYMRRIIAVVGVMAIVALGAYTYSTIKSARYAYTGPISISVQGEGEVLATPDIASFSFIVYAKEADTVTAQNKVSEAMNTIVSYLKEMGVEEKDIKTAHYNLNPRYEYPDPKPVCIARGGYPVEDFIKEGAPLLMAEEFPCTSWDYNRPSEPKLIGYEVTQSVTVKVRDIGKAGEIVSGVGGKGAQDVSGLAFTIDDESVLMAEARAKAIVDAKEKAEALAKNLDARIVRMTGYWENQDGGGYPMYYGKGGDMMEMASTPAMNPAQLPLGENIIRSVVSISYEIR